jgi:hypothetical protein
LLIPEVINHILKHNKLFVKTLNHVDKKCIYPFLNHD